MPALRNALSKHRQSSPLGLRATIAHDDQRRRSSYSPVQASASSLSHCVSPNSLHDQASALPVPSAQSAASGTSRRRRNSDKPPRPRNAFIIFRSNFLVKQRQSGPQQDQNDISVRAGVAWNAMSDAEKKPWQQLAEQEKVEHHQRFPDYNYKFNRASSVHLLSLPVVRPKRLSPSKLRRRVACAPSEADDVQLKSEPQVVTASDLRRVKMEDVIDNPAFIFRSSPSTRSIPSSLESSPSITGSPRTPKWKIEDVKSPVLVQNDLPCPSNKLFLNDPNDLDLSLVWTLRPSGLDAIDEQFGVKSSPPTELDSTFLYSFSDDNTTDHGRSLGLLDNIVDFGAENTELHSALSNLYIPDSFGLLEIPRTPPPTTVIGGTTWSTATALHNIPFTPEGLESKPSLAASPAPSLSYPDDDEMDESPFNYSFDQEVKFAIVDTSEEFAISGSVMGSILDQAWDRYINF